MNRRALSNLQNGLCYWVKNDISGGPTRWRCLSRGASAIEKLHDNTDSQKLLNNAN